MKSHLLTGLTAGLMAVLALAGPSPSAADTAHRAANGRSCGAVFAANRARIESMAASGKTAGVSRMFTAQGCPAPKISVVGTPMAAARIKCTYKFPATIICTFGAR